MTDYARLCNNAMCPRKSLRDEGSREARRKYCGITATKE